MEPTGKRVTVLAKVPQVRVAIATRPSRAAAAFDRAISGADSQVVGLSVAPQPAIPAQAICLMSDCRGATAKARGVLPRPLTGSKTAARWVAAQRPAPLMARHAQPTRLMAHCGCAATHTSGRLAGPRRRGTLLTRTPFAADASSVNFPTVDAQAERLVAPLRRVAPSAFREVTRPTSIGRRAPLMVRVNCSVVLPRVQFQVRQSVIELISVPVVDVVARRDGAVCVFPNLSVLQDSLPANRQHAVAIPRGGPLAIEGTLHDKRVTVAHESPVVGVAQPPQFRGAVAQQARFHFSPIVSQLDGEI